MKTLLFTIAILGFVQIHSQSSHLKVAAFTGDTCQQGDTIDLEGEIYNPTKESVQLIKNKESSLLSDLLGGTKIKPGERIKFNIAYNTIGKYGDVSGSERIRTSDGKWGCSFHWKVYVKADKMPEIEFDEVIITRDSIPRGGDGLFEYHFTNTGNLPLIITRVNTSCGCLVPSFSRDPILPGEKGIIKGRYDTKRIGPINKSMTIRSNAEHPIVVVRLKGSVFVTKEWMKEYKEMQLNRGGVEY
ncbi:MAG: hypothetical protein ACI9J3_001098 [Parvicellaceae bacterium]|jgi:hypothetical protein